MKPHYNTELHFLKLKIPIVRKIIQFYLGICLFLKNKKIYITN